MAEANDAPMMEGFLCPICKGDFGTAMRLLSHFQEEHSEEQDLLKSFKDLFGKAKKKILKQDDYGEYSYSSGGQQSPVSSNIEWEEQEVGHMTSHFKYFQEVRSARLQRFSAPVNQLLIRLDKLLENMPADPAKKKAHEQQKVPWLDGSAVPRCPTCTRTFHLTRRQHHCRLCGAVLCHDCSSFLPLHTAYKILEKPPPENENSNEAALTIRICEICLGLLESSQHQKSTYATKHIINQFYERLSEYRKQADNNLEMFLKMSNSLSNGESTYNLNDAQMLRIKIIHLAESIDSLSGKIAVLGSKDTENPPQGQALALKKAIRAATIAYLKTKLLTLPVLPTEEQLNSIREKRRQEALARLQEEKLREAQYNQGFSHNSPQRRGAPSDFLSSEKGFRVGQGWVPSEKMHQHFSSDDPLIMQINIIQNYIKEARKAHRFDEVASLEANLEELRQECWRNLQEQEEKTHSEDSDEIQTDLAEEDQSSPA
uniref:FYVE-type domain-containing protein n=1 Tax=Graphocephala atropunctata TaxID=36148 RepID=A0A1B6LIM6_9HEMI